MTRLRFEKAEGDAPVQDWLDIHNLIIPTDPLTLDQVRDRARRHHLEVAHLDGLPIGCSTVRPPDDETPAATVIARILPEHRRRGHGAELYTHCLAHARTLGTDAVETVVLASNEDGLRFALNHGYTETERYVLPGDTIPYVTLRLPR